MVYNPRKSKREQFQKQFPSLIGYVQNTDECFDDVDMVQLAYIEANCIDRHKVEQAINNFRARTKPNRKMCIYDEESRIKIFEHELGL